MCDVFERKDMISKKIRKYYIYELDTTIKKCQVHQ